MDNSRIKHPYVTAEGVEIFGKHQVGVRIDVAIGRELSDAEKQVIYKAHQDIVKIINRETSRLDPDVQAGIVEEKAALIALFPQPIYVKPIPNEYGERPHYPWFMVTTSKGNIKIGWRARVINIDWSESDIETTAKELFLNENVTKGERYIHAWGYEKAQEYITAILGAE